MTATTACVKIGPDGLAGVDASLRVSDRSRFQCCLYDHRPPILALGDAHVSVTITVPDPGHVTAQDVATARRLAAELDRYITGLERWHASQGKDKAAEHAAA